MDTLHDRLAELADDAPKGGAPAAELWARGKRTHRLRAAGLLAALLVVGAVGTGIGVRLADGNRSGPPPAETVGIALPIEYPAGEELPDLGDTPGPLAAIWLAPRVGGGAPEAVGLVAETGTFGTLPLDVSYKPEVDPYTPALSPDGRRIAYGSPMGELTVHDLVSGENYNWPALEFETRDAGLGYTWIDATHLVGRVAGRTDADGNVTGGGDGDGWIWEPGTAPKLIDAVTYPGFPYGGPRVGRDLFVTIADGGPRSCSPVTLGDGNYPGEEFDVPVLCDVLGVVGSEILLGHWNSDRLPGDWKDPNDGNGTVVALDIHGADPPFEDPALRRVVVTAGAPERVMFATDLIGEALDADGGAS